MDLLFRHAAALQVKRDCRQDGTKRYRHQWGGVAIVAAKFFLNLDGANRGIHLDSIMKLVVVDGGEIFNKIARPRTAVAARGIEAAVNVQPFILFDRNQIAAKLSIVPVRRRPDAGQIEPIDFFILSKQGIVRRPEHRIPKDADATRSTGGREEIDGGGYAVKRKSVAESRK